MIKVTCRLETYGDKATTSILVHNHWNEREKVDLEVAGERYTLSAKELIAAIQNCTNTAKY